MILMDVQDVMSYLDVSRDYVRWIREDNLLKMWKMGNKWRTSLDDVNEFPALTEDMTCQAEQMFAHSPCSTNESEYSLLSVLTDCPQRRNISHKLKIS